MEATAMDRLLDEVAHLTRARHVRSVSEAVDRALRRLPATSPDSAGESVTAVTSARDVARAYNRYLSALWRGETEEAAAFGAWLASFWTDPSESEPGGSPAAVSACGGRGGHIRWHDTGTGVLGCIPGQGCYRVPVDAAPPVDVLVGVRHRDLPAPPASNQDIESGPKRAIPRQMFADGRSFDA